MKYHVTPDGQITDCTFDSSVCPHAVSSSHYSSTIEAANFVVGRAIEREFFDRLFEIDDAEDLSMFQPF